MGVERAAGLRTRGGWRPDPQPEQAGGGGARPAFPRDRGLPSPQGQWQADGRRPLLPPAFGGAAASCSFISISASSLPCLRESPLRCANVTAGSAIPPYQRKTTGRDARGTLALRAAQAPTRRADRSESGPCPPSERGGVPLQNALREALCGPLAFDLRPLPPVPCLLSPVLRPFPFCTSAPLRENPSPRIRHGWSICPAGALENHQGAAMAGGAPAWCARFASRRLAAAEVAAPAFSAGFRRSPSRP